MADLPWVRTFIDRLNTAGFEYMVTGSIAAMARGEPRYTHDVDIVLRLPETRIDTIIEALSPPRYCVPPKEVIDQEVHRRAKGFFNVIDSELAVKADFYLVGDDPLHEWGLARTEVLQSEDGPIRLAPLEYVIVRKLEYFTESGSDRHLRDIASALAVSGEHVDVPWVEAEIATRGLDDGWAQVQTRLRSMDEA